MNPDIATRPLDELDDAEWEALCDGCGKCCLHKLEDARSGEIDYTAVSCRLLDETTCRCRDYANRAVRVPDCVELRGADPEALSWLPATCAYRLRADGQPLPAWHYLICGDREAVHRAGMSVRGRAISERHVHPDDFEEHLIHWVD